MPTTTYDWVQLPGIPTSGQTITSTDGVNPGWNMHNTATVNNAAGHTAYVGDTVDIGGVTYSIVSWGLASATYTTTDGSFGAWHTPLMTVQPVGGGAPITFLPTRWDAGVTGELQSIQINQYIPMPAGNPIGLTAITQDSTLYCFVEGTRILTRHGEVAIEYLGAGDEVMTLDAGFQPIRWIGCSVVDGAGKFAPVVFAPGAIGNHSTLRVSQQHRILLRERQRDTPDLSLMFGASECLVPARHLVNGDTIRIERAYETAYYHLLFDDHEIVMSEGAATESFHPSAEGLSDMNHELRDELVGIFPELDVDPASYGALARPCLKRHEAVSLLG